MSDTAKEFDRIINEVIQELERLNARSNGPSLPYYVEYDGLRVIEKDPLQNLSFETPAQEAA